MKKAVPRWSITHKYIGFLLVISIFPMLVVGGISYQLARDTLRAEAIHSMQMLVKNQQEYLDLELRQGEDLIANLSGVETIINALDDQTTPTNTYTTLTTRAQIGYILNSYSSLAGLVSIDIFTMGGSHYHVGDTLNVSSIRTDLKDQIYQQSLEAGPHPLWLGIEDNVNTNSGYQKVITAAKILYKTDLQTLQSRPVALLIVNFSTDHLYTHFKQINLGKGGVMMVLDAKNRLIYHPDPGRTGTLVNATIAQQMTSPQGYFVDSSSGKDRIITYHRSPISGWTVVSLTPVNTLMAPVVPIGQATLLAVSLSLLMVALSSLLVSRIMVDPVREITRRFRQFQEGTLNLKERLSYRSQQDEIGDLVVWFNAFLDSMQARQEAETALKESEERYSLALHGANDGIWDWDLRSNQVHYSARWKEMLGIPPDAPLQDPEDWYERVHPHDIERLRNEIKIHLEGQSSHFESEHRLCMPDQATYRWFLARGLAVQEAGQKPHRLAGSLTDITDRKGIEERLKYDTMHDPLTGLYNRVYFIEQLRLTIDRVRRRDGYQAAVLFLDMDRFKIVNDSLGHVCGDQMLVTIAQRLMVCLRSIDTVARFGGDEFVILVEDVDEIQNAIQVANRIQEKLAEPFKLQGQEIFMTVSIGITIITNRYQDPEEILRDADTAMYRAKANGRSGYALFDEGMHAHTLALLRLETDLRRAIERQEFQLFYQPILSLKTGQVTGVEALIRWRHPDQNLVMPGQFLPLAEDTGMIIPIGEWVLHTACKQVKVLQQAGFPELVVHINISTYQLKNQRLPAMVQSAITESGIAPHHLAIEITEYSAMSDLAHTSQALEELKKLGVRLSMDDFGTVYSSLKYLKRFPVQDIKIDQGFVQGCAANSDDAAITTALITMAHLLDLEVVAEGVETAEQAAFLIQNRCDAMQGYLVCSPMPLDQLLLKLHDCTPDWLKAIQPAGLSPYKTD